MTPPSLESTIQDRDSRYGGFANVCNCSNAFRTVFHKAAGLGNISIEDNDYKLSPTQAEALYMIFHKLARIACGDPNYLENWHDIAGYATLVERELTKNQDA